MTRNFSKIARTLRPRFDHIGRASGKSAEIRPWRPLVKDGWRCETLDSDQTLMPLLRY